jgi:hypothetical protein
MLVAPERPKRHAFLFELIRQDNLARDVCERVTQDHLDPDWTAAFTARALKSLRG